MAKAKLTEAEKERRKHQRKADAMNKAEVKAYGPLFAELAPVHTADEAYANWRLWKAGSAGNHLRRGLEWINVQAIERHAVAMLGDVANDIAAYVRKVYPMPDYAPHVWSEVLTMGKRFVYRWALKFDPARVNANNKDGRYLVEDGVLEATAPVMTREEFRAKFPPVPLMGRAEDDAPTEDDEKMLAVLQNYLTRWQS